MDDNQLTPEQYRYNNDLAALERMKAVATFIAESDDADPLLADFAAEVDEVLRGLPDPVRTRRLIADVRSEGEPHCICGQHR